MSDPHKFLIDDPPSPNILMTNFRVAHHGAFGGGWQANILPACPNQGGGAGSLEHLSYWSIGKANGIKAIVLWVRILSPAVADDEDSWWGGWGHVKSVHILAVGGILEA